MTRRLALLLFVVSGALMVTAVVLWWPQATAEAQCGSQASSCKNCHEVQGLKPVNKDGTSWHQSHAFGDFCANCHAGNVQSTDKTAAHTAMLAPLSDIKANCAACHPSDTQARAQKYAVLLGVQLGGGDSGGGTTTTTNNPTPAGDSTPAPATPATAATPAPVATTVAAANTDGIPGLIDYNLQYVETVQGQWPINWGNVLLGVMIVMVGGGGGTFAYFNERKLRRAAGPGSSQPASPIPAATATLVDAPLTAPDLLPQLEKLDPRSLRALKQILREPEMANGLFLTLARLDPRLIEDVRRLDRREMTLLMALAEEK